jgi:hypothetical protein
LPTLPPLSPSTLSRCCPSHRGGAKAGHGSRHRLQWGARQDRAQPARFGAVGPGGPAVHRIGSQRGTGRCSRRGTGGGVPFHAACMLGKSPCAKESTCSCRTVSPFDGTSADSGAPSCSQGKPAPDVYLEVMRRLGCGDDPEVSWAGEGTSLQPSRQNLTTSLSWRSLSLKNEIRFAWMCLSGDDLQSHSLSLQGLGKPLAPANTANPGLHPSHPTTTTPTRWQHQRHPQTS